jgi:hypothetical protein
VVRVVVGVGVAVAVVVTVVGGGVGGGVGGVVAVAVGVAVGVGVVVVVALVVGVGVGEPLMWIYSQSKHTLWRIGSDNSLGTLTTACYAGSPEGLNDPAKQEIPDVGPIPQGAYTIGAPFTDPERGPVVMHLAPKLGTNTFERSGFLFHGDAIDPDLRGKISTGCIVVPHGPRATIAASPDRNLFVVP